MESQSSSLQVPLLSNQETSHDFDTTTYGGEMIEEMKRQLGLAVPLIAVNILQYCLQVISIMFVGHLGELPLSGASMATSFASVTGFSVLLGMGSALETLCGQAYGAKQYHMLGIYTQRAMLVLLSLSILLSLIWFNTSTILIACDQDHDISNEAGQFNRWMIPGLFAYGILQCLNRFLQTQNRVMSMMLTSGFTALLHILVCWLFVFKIGLGSKGAALANAISYWVNVFLLAGYVKFSPACRKTWTGFSKEALDDVLDFIKLAIPSAIMICFEYWSFEMVVLLSGLLPNPKLETSVLSISLNTCWMVYMVSVGLGGAISTRVSNELGAGCAQGARLALHVVVIVAISVGLIIAITTILVRFVWGKLYSNEKEVIRYVAKILPLLALSDFLDGFQCVLSGAARGCGWQKLCAFINLGAYYVVGLPSSILFAFVFDTGGMGLWIGIICALLVQNVALIAINICTNWDKEIGMASALETLSGQAYGAQQYKEVGTQTYTAIFSLLIVSIPISILCIYMEYILIFMGQDSQISHEAGRFLKFLLPTLFGYATLQPLIRYYLMQSMIIPLLISSCLTITIHLPLCWVLVFHTGLKNPGAVFAMDISIWLNVTILASYMRYSPTCEKTRVPIISWEVLYGMKEFFKFAIPSAIMICLEGWSFEIIILLSGLVPNPQLETSVLSVCLNTLSTLYSIPYGLSAAVSTRVSNELGGGNPQGARTSVLIVMILAVMEAILASTILFACRNFFGYIFSNDKQVGEYLSKLAPLVCLSVIMDTIQATLSG